MKEARNLSSLRDDTWMSLSRAISKQKGIQVATM